MNVTTGIPLHLLVRDAREGKRSTAERMARELEELDFWAIAVPDHILSHGVGPLGHMPDEHLRLRNPDPLAMLAYLAAITTRIKLMARVLVVPYRQPFTVAHALATIDSLSGGRLVVGIGPGYEQTEFDVMAVPRSRRGKITDEHMRIILELWARDRVSFDGQYYRFKDASLLVKPVQQPRPPIWVGGNVQASVERAVRIGDAWTPNCFGYPEIDPGVRNGITKQQFVEAREWSLEQRLAAGKAPLEYAVSSGPPLRFLDKSERAMPVPGSGVQRFTCIGTPDELLEEFLAFKEAGATSFVVNFTASTLDQYLKDARTFARRIMTHLG